ncbi:MAG: hypothetical protein SH859_08395, partial [Hyphomicrobium aestuarii]|nr:hypothetical protein [Hyphomicrobium aestuarii]
MNDIMVPPGMSAPGPSTSGGAPRTKAAGLAGQPIPGLLAIPVLDTGPGFALDTLDADPARAHRLLDAPTKYVPKQALKALDSVSRQWLVKWDNAYLPEIDAIAARLDRPGV